MKPKKIDNKSIFLRRLTTFWPGVKPLISICDVMSIVSVLTPSSGLLVPHTGQISESNLVKRAPQLRQLGIITSLNILIFIN